MTVFDDHGLFLPAVVEVDGNTFAGGLIRKVGGITSAMSYDQTTGPILATCTTQVDIADLDGSLGADLEVADAFGAPVADGTIIAETRVDITNATYASQMITFTTGSTPATAHGFSVGSTTTIVGVTSSPAGSFNGTYVIVEVPTANTFKVKKPANPGSYTANGYAEGKAGIVYSILTGTTFERCTAASGGGYVFVGSTIIAGENPDPMLGTALYIDRTASISADYAAGDYGPSPVTLVPTLAGIFYPRGVIQVEGIFTLDQDVSPLFGVPVGSQLSVSYTNGVGVTKITNGIGYAHAPTVWSTESGVVFPVFPSFNRPGENQGWSIGFTDNPLFGSGVDATLGQIQQVSFLANSYLGPDTSVLRRYGLLVNDTTFADGASPTVATQTGVAIGSLADDGFTFSKFVNADTNIGLLNASTTVLIPTAMVNLEGGFTIEADATTVILTSEDSGAPIVAKADGPAITPDPAIVGQQIHLINGNAASTGTMTFITGSTTKLALGAPSRTLGAGGSLTLLYASSTLGWVELAFSPGQVSGHSLVPSGVLAETFSRIGPLANVSTLSTRRISCTAIDLPAGMTVSSITFWSGSTAAASPTHQWAGLYSDTLEELAVSSDYTTNAWAANAAKTFTLTSTFTTTYSGLHYLGLCVEATTVPTLSGASGLSPSGPYSMTPNLSFAANTKSSPATPGGISPLTNTGAVGQLLWAYVA